MKKTQLTDALRNIKKRFVSYLSIVFIIMLGTGSFFMTRYLAKNIAGNASSFYRDQNFRDFEIASSIGISQSDLTRLSEVEGVANTEGAMVIDGSYIASDVPTSVTLMSWTEEISIPELLEGSRPEKPDECAVALDFALAKNISVGDKIHLIADPLFNTNPLPASDFTVTGLIRHPDHIRPTRSHVIVLPLSAFDFKALENRYTRAFITAENTDRSNFFTSSYTDSIYPVKLRLNELMDEFAHRSGNEAKDLLNRRIDEEWEKAQAQIDDARRQISDGEAELAARLAEALRQLAAGRSQLASAYQQLISGEAQLKDAEAMLASFQDVMKLLRGKSPLELLSFLNEVNGYIDSYESTDDELARMEIRKALIGFLSADPAREYVAIIKDIAGLDLIEVADNPPSFIPARNAIRDITSILLLAAAADQGINPIDLYHDVVTFNTLVDEINAAPNEEAANAAREKLHAFLSNPEVQYRLSFVSLYLGIDISQLIELTSSRALDEYQQGRLQMLVQQMRIAKNSIANAEAMIAQGRAKLAAGWAQYYAGLKLLQEKEAEMKALADQARAELDKSRGELEAKIREAEETLAKARADVDALKSNWILQDAVVNLGYTDVSGNITAINALSYALGGLLMIVAALVCFSTLVMIIEEERKLVGATKAFGFTNPEILLKYLIFGVSAALFGSLLGALFGTIAMRLACKMLEDIMMYAFTFRTFPIEPGVTVLVCSGAVLLCGLVSFIACTGLLKNSAYNLLNGITAPKKHLKLRASSRGSAKSLYSRLIFRNMINEKSRVLISIIITAAGCLIVGTGFTLKFSFDGMNYRQISDVMIYDCRLDYTDVPSEELRRFETALDQAGIRYLPASYTGHLVRQGDGLIGVNLLCTDGTQINDFIRLQQAYRSTPVSLPEEGLLIPNKLDEAFGIHPGDAITLYDSTLNSASASISGIYRNHIGRLMICSESTYRNVFGTEPVNNAYYILRNGVSEADFEAILADFQGYFAMETNDYFIKDLSQTFLIYNLVVAVCIVVAVLMSFIILTNLANIFINRKKKELTVMRINGFTISETINYLTKEAIATTVIGLLLGVLMGAFVVAPLLVRLIEPAECMFIRSPNLISWIAAVLIEGLFALVINTSVFRKVRTLSFRDVM